MNILEATLFIHFIGGIMALAINYVGYLIEFITDKKYFIQKMFGAYLMSWFFVAFVITGAIWLILRQLFLKLMSVLFFDGWYVDMEDVSKFLYEKTVENVREKLYKF